MDYLDYLGQKLNDSWKSVKNYFGEDEDQIKFTPHWPSSSPQKTANTLPSTIYKETPTPLLQKEKNIFDSPALNKFVTNNYLDSLAKDQQMPNIAKGVMGASTTPNKEISITGASSSPNEEIALNEPSDELSYEPSELIDPAELTPREYESYNKLVDSGYFEMLEKQKELDKEWEEQVKLGNFKAAPKFIKRNEIIYNNWIIKWGNGIKDGEWKEEDMDNVMNAFQKKLQRRP